MFSSKGLPELWASNRNKDIWKYIYVYTHAHICIHTYVYIHVHIYVYTQCHTYTYKYMYVYTYTLNTLTIYKRHYSPVIHCSTTWHASCSCPFSKSSSSRSNCTLDRSCEPWYLDDNCCRPENANSNLLIVMIIIYNVTIKGITIN